MNQIKFRAWHSKSKTMIPWEKLTLLMSGERLRMMEKLEVKPYNIQKMSDTIKCYELQPGNPFNNSDLTFMQYSGLKDKNGKEIYDQDILLNYETQRFLLDYNIFGSWTCYNLSNSSDRRGLFEFFNISEVIGNYYERPDWRDYV